MRANTQLITFPVVRRYVPTLLNEGAVQRLLAHFNRERLHPGLGDELRPEIAAAHGRAAEKEKLFVASARRQVAHWLEAVPDTPDAFVAWFEALRDIGPGQNDPLFPWLAEEATLEEMRWFLTQEVAGEAGFDDLVAMTQVKMPTQAKLEMARNYWDEMGRGQQAGMHGPMLEKLSDFLDLSPSIESTVEESLALGNMMIALAANRAFAFHSVGALGVIELTAPGRAAFVARGLNRLGVPKKISHYFALHAVLDVKHSAEWNAECLAPLVREDSRRARAIAEGAILRLWCGQRCFQRYRRHFAIAA